MAANRSVERKITDLDNTHLTCRLRHTWQFKGFFNHDGGITGIHDCLACFARCYTFYTQAMVREGARYEYPEGYLVKGRVEQIAVRRELVKRIKPRGGREPEREI